MRICQQYNNKKSKKNTHKKPKFKRPVKKTTELDQTVSHDLPPIQSPP